MSHEPPPVPEMDPEMLPQIEEQAVRSMDSSGRKFFLLVCVAAVCIGIVHFTPLGGHLTDAWAWKARIEESGIAGLLLFFVLATAFITVGVPRTVFCAAAGLLFGFVRGILLAQAASVAGSYFTFLFARWAGRPWVSKILARNDKLRTLVENPSLASIVLVRQLPITCAVPNLLYGLTPIRHGAYLWGTFLGMAPSTVIASLLGSGLGEESPWMALLQLFLAMAAVSLIALLGWRFRRRRRARRAERSGGLREET